METEENEFHNNDNEKIKDAKQKLEQATNNEQIKLKSLDERISISEKVNWYDPDELEPCSINSRLYNSEKMFLRWSINCLWTGS